METCFMLMMKHWLTIDRKKFQFKHKMWLNFWIMLLRLQIQIQLKILQLRLMELCHWLSKFLGFSQWLSEITSFLDENWMKIDTIMWLRFVNLEVIFKYLMEEIWQKLERKVLIFQEDRKQDWVLLEQYMQTEISF